MVSLGMTGPYDLTPNKINAVVAQASPGNYALGHKSDDTFYVSYVGRSDSDVRGRLLSWAGKKSKYESFKYAYASSPKAAFEKECRNYHDFGGSKKLDNGSHPDRPDGTDWKCPVCNIFAY